VKNQQLALQRANNDSAPYAIEYVGL